MNQPLKPGDWRTIASEASKETDPAKLTRLVAQLCRSLDERDKVKRAAAAGTA